MQESAIDYLMKQIGEGKIQSTYTKCGYLIEIHDDVLEIAKEIEKNQIKKAFIDGGLEYVLNIANDSPPCSNGYYNKKYNNGQDS
jgi:hypothetical protein